MKILERLRNLVERIIEIIRPGRPDTPPPKPQPEPEPQPPIVVPPPEPLPGTMPDEIDPSTIIYDEPAGNVGAWQITANFYSVQFLSDGMSGLREHLGKPWPLAPPPNPKRTIGNWWIVALWEGVWRACTIEWLGENKTRVVGKRWDGTDDFHGPLTNWRPKSGETIYAFQSGCARAGATTVKERTQIVKVMIP